jgi:recombination DNA repair RAD52 pathway protein
MNVALNRLVGILAAIVLCFTATGIANAQDEQIKQIKLTEAQVKGYISAGKALAEVSEKIEAGGDKPDPKLLAQLEDIAKSNGFKSYEELDLVVSNVSLILSGMDDKGNFTEPSEVLKDELEQVKGDKTIKAKEKKEYTEEIEAAIKSTPKVQFMSNVALVKKYLKQLDALQPKDKEK